VRKKVGWYYDILWYRLRTSATTIMVEAIKRTTLPRREYAHPRLTVLLEFRMVR